MSLPIWAAVFGTSMAIFGAGTFIMALWAVFKGNLKTFISNVADEHFSNTHYMTKRRIEELECWVQKLRDSQYRAP